MKNDFRGEFNHSIWFLKDGESTPRNTIEDFALFPTKRQSFPVADTDNWNEEIEGRSGSYFWHKVIDKSPSRKTASGDFEFDILTDYDQLYDWNDELEKMVNYFDGSLFTLWLNDEPNDFVRGRVWLDGDSYDSPSGDFSTIKLKYTLID